MTTEQTPIPQPPDAEPTNDLTAHFEKLSHLYSLSDDLTTSGNLQNVLAYTVVEAQRLGSTPELLERNEVGLMMMSLADQMLQVDNEIAAIERALPHVYDALPQTNTGKREMYESGVKEIHEKNEALHDEKERLRLLMMYCQFDPVRRRHDGSYTNIARTHITKAEVNDLHAVASIEAKVTLDAVTRDTEVEQAEAVRPPETPSDSVTTGDKLAEQPEDAFKDLFAWGSGTTLNYVRGKLRITPETEKPFKRTVLPNSQKREGAWAQFEVVDETVKRSLVIRAGAAIHHQLEHEYAHTQTELGFAFGYNGIFMEGLNEATTENATSNPRAYKLQRDVVQIIQNEVIADKPELVTAAYKGDQEARDELYRLVVQTYGLRGYNVLARMVGGASEVLFHTDIHLLTPCSEVMDVLREEKERVGKIKEGKKGMFTDLGEWLKKLGR